MDTSSYLGEQADRGHAEHSRQVAIKRAVRRMQLPAESDRVKIIQTNLALSETSRKYESAPAFVPCSYDRVQNGEIDDTRTTSAIIRTLKTEREGKKEAIDRLRKVYRRLNHRWQQHRAFLDNADLFIDGESAQRHPLYGNRIDASADRAESAENGRASSSQPNATQGGSMGSISHNHDDGSFAAGLSRSNRRNTNSGGFAGFGDAVRSEAEFLEILASLENADMQDPSMRAARTTATEPDMIIRPSTDKPNANHEGGNAYDDDNGFVADPVAFYLSDFDPDYWTEEDKTIFEKRYALFPKQFGKIAAGLSDKSTAQCVSYYYQTKKFKDYKSMLTSKNRDRRRKTKLVKPRKGRGSALMADLKGATTVDESPADEEDSLVLSDLPAESSAAAPSGKRGLRQGGRNEKRSMLAIEKVKAEDSAVESPPFSGPEETPLSEMGSTDASKQHRTPARHATSSYWSIAERTQFLRSLAIFGRDWESLANNLTTKSAAQARNFYVRNAEDVDFVEAVQLARGNETLSVEERTVAADAFVQRRGSQQLPPEAAAAPIASAQSGRLNINALLNADVESSNRDRRASLVDWFGGSNGASAGHPPPSRNSDRMPQAYAHSSASHELDIPHRNARDDSWAGQRDHLAYERPQYRPSSASGYYQQDSHGRGDYGSQVYQRRWPAFDTYQREYEPSSRASYRNEAAAEMHQEQHQHQHQHQPQQQQQQQQQPFAYPYRSNERSADPYRSGRSSYSPPRRRDYQQ